MWCGGLSGAVSGVRQMCSMAHGSRRVPYGHWRSKGNRRAFLDNVAATMGLHKPEDWKRVDVKQLRDAGGAGLLKLYSDSVVRMLQDVYPEEVWRTHECRSRLPQGYWQCPDNRRAFMERLAERMGVEDAAGWRQVGEQHVNDAGGATLLRRYSGSIDRLVADTMPERYADVQTCRRWVPQEHWAESENRQAFVLALAEELGISKVEDWKAVGVSAFVERGASGLLRWSSEGIVGVLRDVYPHWRVTSANSRPKQPRHYWQDKANRRRFLEEVAAAHGIREAQGWRKLSRTDLMQAGGGSLLCYYTSLFDALRDCFPEMEWDERLCRAQVAADHWEKEENVRSFLDLVKRELGIVQKEDWYRVANHQIATLQGGGLLKRMSLPDALALAYGGDWSPELFGNGVVKKKSSQRLMMVHAAAIFSGTKQASAAS